MATKIIIAFMQEMSTVDTEGTLKSFRSKFFPAHMRKNRFVRRDSCSQMKAKGLSNISSFVADLHQKEQKLDLLGSRKSIRELFLGSTKDRTCSEFEADSFSNNSFFKDAPPIEYHDRLDQRTNIAALITHNNRMNKSINSRGRRSKSQWCIKAVKNDLFGIKI